MTSSSADLTKPHSPNFLTQAYGLIPNGILAVWPASKKLKLFAFMTDGVQLMTAVFYTWANEIMANDNECMYQFLHRLRLDNHPLTVRALTIGSMNGLQYSVSAWLPIVIFPQTMYVLSA